MPSRTILLNERIWVVKAFTRYNENPGEVRRHWPFPTPPPARSSIIAISKKFNEHGGVKDLKRCGRSKSARNQTNIDAISFSIQVSQQASVRELARETGINRESVRKILKKDLNMKAYHATEVAGLKPDDYQKRY